ncbi:MAG: hypothetical protein LUF92_01400 [Clostridiales bacterium]|nr:hypothetical protein [Clostridiales bacterium]
MKNLITTEKKEAADEEIPSYEPAVLKGRKALVIGEHENRVQKLKEVLPE